MSYNKNNHKNIIIFDYDDTIFPTNIINNIHNNNINNISILQSLELNHLDNIICNLFQTILSNHPNIYLYIVTNSQTGWIANTTLKFLPKFNEFLTNYNNSHYQFCIISARDNFEKIWPNDPIMWKIKCFENILNKHEQEEKIKNIISIGDGEPEYKAINFINTFKNNIFGKSLNFIQEPSTIKQIIDQLVLTQNILFSHVIPHPSQINLRMRPRVLVQ